MLWLSALHADLKALEQRSPRAQYYGVLSRQGSCPAGESYYGSKRTDADITCAGCYGGAVSDGGALCRATRCDNGPPPNHRRCWQVGCPRSLRMVPFAIGALMSESVISRRRSLPARMRTLTSIGYPPTVPHSTQCARQWMARRAMRSANAWTACA